VVSAPLILGLDITQQALLEPIIDVITNHEAIAVNQEWAGHPGALVWSGHGGALGYPAARKCNTVNPALHQVGWALVSRPTAGEVMLQAPGGGCLTVQGAGYPGGAGGLVIARCNSSYAAQGFKYDEATKQISSVSNGRCVDIHSGGPILWMYGCSAGPNDKLTIAANKTLEGAGLCVGVEQDDPAGATYQSALQAWAKPLNSSVAVLLINPDTVSHDFSVPLSVLPFSETCTDLTGLAVRDIWEHTNLTSIPSGVSMLNVTVGPMDSAFLKLTPT